MKQPVILTLLIAATLVAVAVAWVGPYATYYNFVEHHGSPAYFSRSVSFLKGHHHARVCDKMPNLHNEYVIVDVRGPNIKKYDPDGARKKNCGDAFFGRYGRGHKTCSGNNCHAWSWHRN